MHTQLPSLRFELVGRETAIAYGLRRLRVQASGFVRIGPQPSPAQSGGFDIIHVSCHGESHPQPILIFETETGERHKVSPQTLIAELGQHRPKLLFVSACKTARQEAPLQSFLIAVLQTGIPAALGWGGSVRDDAATLFASEQWRGFEADPRGVEDGRIVRAGRAKGTRLGIACEDPCGSRRDRGRSGSALRGIEGV